MLKFPSQRRRKTGGSQGYLSPSYLRGVVQGAKRWSLLIIKALGEASRKLAVLVKSAVQQQGSKQGKATSACLPGKKVVGKESVFAIVVFACNKKKHSQLSERELLAQAVEQRANKLWSFGSPVNTAWNVWPCFMTSPHVLTLWPPCHPREGIKWVWKKNLPLSDYKGNITRHWVEQRWRMISKKIIEHVVICSLLCFNFYLLVAHFASHASKCEREGECT